MKNNKGFAEVVLLSYIIAGLILFFVPNPLSNAVGVGIRPNKTVHTEKVDLIKQDGQVIGTRTVTQDDDVQQRVGFWEWLMSLPIMVLILMGLGIIFPPVSLVLGKIYSSLKKETKRIVVSVDKALDHVHDPVVKETILSKMAETQDTSTKKLVDQIQGKP